LYDAQSAAAMFFEKLLSHPQHGEAARKYLAERGFNAESIQRFRIGFAADRWDALLSSATMKKFTAAPMALAGLAKPRERGDGHYDTFRNRLMFPIRDENGRVIAFGGRKMRAEDEPKYLNSPETPVFEKSRILFGLDLARAKIVETRMVAVVEGYTDVVMAHQFGISNVVCAMGTALTEKHVIMLRRFADRIVLLFDGDRAGVNAANRAVELFLSQPVEIAIASLPDGLDPDEFLLKHGADAFNEILANAMDALAFKWKQLVRDVNSQDGLTGRQQAVQQYLEMLASARGSETIDPIRWGSALARVSRLAEIPMEELNRRFRVKLGKGRPAPVKTQVAEANEPKKDAPAPRPTARQLAEGFILGLLLSEAGRWQQIQQSLGPADFTEESLRRIAELFWRHCEDEGEPVFNEFLDHLPDVELKGAAVRWADMAANSSEKERYLSDSLLHIIRDRECEEKQKLVVELRTHQQLDTLRKLQEKARLPDLKRVTL
jgi:DNA primase